MNRLKPISQNEECGKYLRYNSSYVEIKNAVRKILDVSDMSETDVANRVKYMFSQSYDLSLIYFSLIINSVSMFCTDKITMFESALYDIYDVLTFYWEKYHPNFEDVGIFYTYMRLHDIRMIDSAIVFVYSNCVVCENIVLTSIVDQKQDSIIYSSIAKNKDSYFKLLEKLNSIILIMEKINEFWKKKSSLFTEEDYPNLIMNKIIEFSTSIISTIKRMQKSQGIIYEKKELTEKNNQQEINFNEIVKNIKLNINLLKESKEYSNLYKCLDFVINTIGINSENIANIFNNEKAIDLLKNGNKIR